jgi:hypothetical protein
MSSRVELFMSVATGDVTRQLRRYRNSRDDDPTSKCPSDFSYHNGYADLDRVPAVYADPERQTIKGYVERDEMPARDDPRWPTKCDKCEYIFAETDEWQVFIESIYKREDTGEEFTLRAAPPGAVWECPWYGKTGPDGHCYCVMTPGGEWLPDLPSKQGTPWTRTGVAPKITCRPSILITDHKGVEKYHGFLTDGVLVSC